MNEQQRRWQRMRELAIPAMQEYERQRAGLRPNEWWDERLKGRGPDECRYYAAGGFFQCRGCGAVRRATEAVDAKSHGDEPCEVCGNCEALTLTHWEPIEPPWNWKPVMSGVIPCRRAA